MTKQNYEPYVAPSGTSGWFLPSIYQWNMIVNGLTNSAISFTTSSNNALKSSVFYNPLTSAGGTALQSGYYLFSTEYSNNRVWLYYSLQGQADYGAKINPHHVRAILAF